MKQMKNLGKCTVMILLICFMLFLVMQDFIPTNDLNGFMENFGNLKPTGSYIMTNATIDTQGNTIIKTIDSSGNFNLDVFTNNINSHS